MDGSALRLHDSIASWFGVSLWAAGEVEMVQTGRSAFVSHLEFLIRVRVVARSATMAERNSVSWMDLLCARMIRSLLGLAFYAREMKFGNLRDLRNKI
ncbi:MAG: hypothetical protein EOP05_17255 [Proteobacteria bacterium]|nr:MAG: hypothetical protein EOP05_17255 [Pseudomonadota bacterium]